jgi:formamidopyrimidine-DNA glycosylase
VSGKTLVEVNLISGRYTTKPPQGFETFQARLPTRVIGTGVHGKFLYWVVDNDVFVYNTLGMTGCWTRQRMKHSRAEFKFSDGTSIFFTDQRNFGTLKFVPGRSALIEKLKTLGPDMLSQKVSDELFSQRLRKKTKWTLAKAIMDQSVIAGVGNYVKAEALYRAQLSPHRAVTSLSADDMSRLNGAVQAVLREAYEKRGASIQTYRDVNGEEGQYNRFFRVYNQDKDPHGNQVVKEKTDDGRTTHWVPAVQK